MKNRLLNTEHRSPNTDHILLSVVLAVRNEEENIGRCLESVKDITDEIIVFDEHSTDRTREIAKKFGAKVIEVDHEPIFHITKQKAINKASGEWILQLDADEIITPQLANEIKDVMQMSSEEILTRENTDAYKSRLFERHTKAIVKRDGPIGKNNGEIAAFFIPRKNMFLGKPLIYAGVYPDPAIRLFKKGKAYLPAKSVHEIMQVDGQVAWLFNDMEHHDSPTLRRYFARLNRYTDLHAAELAGQKVGKSFWNLFIYSVIKPILIFLKLFFRHKGFMDGMGGFLWSALSASHYPIAYYKYYTGGFKK